MNEKEHRQLCVMETRGIYAKELRALEQMDLSTVIGISFEVKFRTNVMGSPTLKLSTPCGLNGDSGQLSLSRLMLDAFKQIVDFRKKQLREFLGL